MAYDYLQLLKDHGMIIGEYDPSKVDGLPLQWFWDRQVYIDFRGDLYISRYNVTLGKRVEIITATHDMSSGELGPTIPKKVHIHSHVYVGNRAKLYNCTLEHHCVVACGAVVRNMTVRSYTMVEGNPARVYKEYIDGAWRKV